MNKIAAAAKAAFPNTIPIMAGYLFVGAAYGILVRSLGFPFYAPILISIFVFAGAMQFVLADMMILPFAPVSAFFATLIFNARHIFYGLSMLGKYGKLGKKRFPIIFWMSDETFSVNCSVEVPQGIDKGWFYFFVSVFDYSYWIAGTTIGSIGGQFIPFDTTGIDFVMTALFLVIFVGQWEKEKSHISSLGGLAISLICLVIFGSGNFILPSMIAIILFLTLLRRPIERRIAP